MQVIWEDKGFRQLGQMGSQRSTRFLGVYSKHGTENTARVVADPGCQQSPARDKSATTCAYTLFVCYLTRSARIFFVWGRKKCAQKYYYGCDQCLYWGFWTLFFLGQKSTFLVKNPVRGSAHVGGRISSPRWIWTVKTSPRCTSDVA